MPFMLNDVFLRVVYIGHNFNAHNTNLHLLYGLVKSTENANRTT